jgi:hypothetical protein
MSVYTVHEPPLRTADMAAEPHRFVFVRDGFSWWAFLLAPLWMLRYRLWLALVLYVLITTALEILLRGLGASTLAQTVAGVLIAVLVGLEASTLRRSKLKRRHWRNVGVVTGESLEDAERRFFSAWIGQRGAAAAPSSRSAAAGSPAPPAATPAAASPGEQTGVIGLFPESGAQT